jgi:DNA-directed RNA polymerase subunit K
MGYTRAEQGEVYGGWSWKVIRCSPGFSKPILVGLGPVPLEESRFGLGKVEVGAPDCGPLRPSHLENAPSPRPGARPAMRYTRFEKARIIGARALQISMGSPILIDVPVGVVDPIEIAWIEFNSGAIPITVKRES